MKDDRKIATVTIRLSPAWKKKLFDAARAEDRSVTAVIVRAVNAYVEAQKKDSSRAS